MNTRSSDNRPGSVEMPDVRTAADALLEAVPDGAPLQPDAAALVKLGVCAAVSTLDPAGIDEAMRAALDGGATPDQVHETLVVVSGLGVHTLMVGSRQLSAILRERAAPRRPDDDDRAALRARLPGESSYWKGVERELPGFLDALLEHSPEAYEAFFAYCAVPWRTGAVTAQVKELVAMACDATPAHRFLPGMRLHLANAVRLGVGKSAIRATLDIAATAPLHPGVPAAR